MKKIFSLFFMLVCTLYIQAREIKNPTPSSFPDHLEIVIDTFHLSLDWVEINPIIQLSSGNHIPDNGKMFFYRNSYAAFGFYNGEAMGVILTSAGNYNVGKSGNEYVIFNDNQFVNNYSCTELLGNPEQLRTTGVNSVLTIPKCINLYWETDYDLYLNKGSAANVSFYIQGIFNVVQLLYSRDSITVNLHKLFIWDYQDPYTGPATSDYLTQFNNYRPTYDGDVGHLIGLNGNGGIAWVNTLPYQQSLRTGYSGIFTTYSNLPTYSWTVDCITHEHGHIFGSEHTHDCVWNGNNTRIDDCGTHAGAATAGACGPDIPDPIAGGLIMGYCQLRPVGKNLMLGFGAQSRDTIRGRMSRANTLSSNCSCMLPVIPNKISGLSPVLKMSIGIYSTNFVSGCTYNWFLPPSAIGLSSTNSISINFTDTYAGGELCVTASNACGVGDSSCITVDVDLTNEPLSIEEILFAHKKGKVHIYDMLGKEILKPDDLWIHGIYILKSENYFRKIFR